MKKSRHNLYQLLQVLTKVEKGRSEIALARADKISTATFFHKKATYNDMYMNLLSAQKQLKDENQQLQQKRSQLKLLRDWTEKTAQTGIKKPE